MEENKVTKSEQDLNQKKPKTKFKMPSSLSIVLIVLFAIIVLTWILDWTGASTVVAGDDVEVQAAGLLSFGNAIVAGFSDAGSLIVYLFVLGGFIELMMRTGSLEQGIKTLVFKLEGKEIVLIPLLFLLFSLGGTIYGMQEETVGFFILIVPFLIIAGFDSMTGLLVILLGTTTGFSASIINPFSIGAAVDSSGVEGLNVGVAIGARTVIWIVFTMIGALFVTGYAFHVQKSPGKSVVADDHDKNLEWAKQNFGTLDVSDHRKTTKREITGLILFASAFIIMIFMYIPWTSFFDSYATHVDDNGFIYPPGLGWLFNGMNYPGVWYFGELVMEFLLFSLAIGYVFKMKLSEISDAMWTGAKDILPVAIIIGVARAIPQVMTESSMDVFLVGSLTNNLGGLSPIVFLMVIFIVFLILACFIPSTSGLAGLSMPIIAAIAVSIFADQPGFGGPDGDGTILMLGYIIIMFSIAVGLINMFIPTQAIVLASAEAAKVPYTKMLKPVLIYSGGLAIFTLVVVAPILGAIVV